MLDYSNHSHLKYFSSQGTPFPIMILIAKLKAIWFRFRYLFRSYPNRIQRLIRCFDFYWYPQFKYLIKSPVDWMVFCVLVIFDLLAIPEVLEILHELVKWKLKDLSHREAKLLDEVFAGKLSLEGIRLDAQAVLGPKQWGIAYVSFHTINSYGPISLRLLIHELVHIWQYKRFGSYYIIKALKAQNSKETYNYRSINDLD